MRYEAKIDAPVMEIKGTVQEQDDGSLIIEGLAAEFSVDRQDEAFLPGAFDRGIKAFMETNPLLAYHHGAFGGARPVAGGIRSPELIPMGQVQSLWVEPDGMHMKARVDKPASGSWAEDIYDKVKSGTIRMLSVGGKFERAMTAKGMKIYDVDLQEISLTPLSVGKKTSFSVISGKAFMEEPAADEPDPELLARLVALEETLATVEGKAAIPTAEQANDADKRYIAAAIQHAEGHLNSLEDVVTNGQNPKVRKHAQDQLEHYAGSLKTLHRLAATHGPLPTYW